MPTNENLQDAFAGESQANRKYIAFARKADADGLPGVARLFRAAAEAETVHALAHLKVMGGVKDTAENIQAAIEGEGYEFLTMYPEFIAAAKAEGNKAAVESFENAMVVEKLHHEMYLHALSAISAGKDLKHSKYFVCLICGNTVADGAPDRCPICGNPKAGFKLVE